MANETSGFRFYSIGIVTADKPKNSWVIDVFPVEAISNVQGKVDEWKPSQKASLPDAKGVTRTSSVQGSATIKAKWTPLSDSNRTTAPDVVKNESVMIYVFGDDPTFYWTTIKHEPKLRRLETVRWSFCDLPSGMNEYTEESSYWFEVSTDKKTITLHTSNSDGEAFKYDFVIDAGNSQVYIADDGGNHFLMDSKEKVFRMKNIDGTIMEINKHNATISNTDGNSVKMTAGAVNVTTPGTVTVTAPGGITLDGPVLMTKGVSMKAGSGGAAASIEGETIMKGSLSATGPISSATSVTAPNID